jgi:cytoskeletal protein RodZ
VARFSSSQIEQLKEIGACLQQKRLEQSLSLQQISSSTKIRPGLLTAIEEGQVDQLPEPIYLQGLIRHYGSALQIDGDALAKTLSPKDVSLDTETPAEEVLRKPSLPPLEMPKSSGRYFLFALLLVSAVGGLFFLLNRPATQEPISPKSSRPAIQSPLPTPKIVPPKPRLSPSPPASADRGKVAATVSLEGASWVRIKVDGQIVFEGVLNKGEQKTWTAQKQLSIRAGNAGNVKVSSAQKPPQTLGRLGEVKEINLTPSQ